MPKLFQMSQINLAHRGSVHQKSCFASIAMHDRCHNHCIQRVTIDILVHLYSLWQRCSRIVNLLNARKPAPGMHVQ